MQSCYLLTQNVEAHTFIIKIMTSVCEGKAYLVTMKPHQAHSCSHFKYGGMVLIGYMSL